MTVGSLFPVVGPHGEQLWWVIPEGLTGQAFSLVTGRFTKYTTVQAAKKPANAVAGPFTTQATAQAAASQMTSSAIPGPATPGAAVSDIGSLFANSAVWVRVGEFLAGLILLYVGLKAEFPTTVNTIVQPVKNTARGTLNAAKLGLI